MMPLALDLISTLVIGSTLPVATTDRTMVPRSTVAMRLESTSADAPLSVTSPYAAGTSTITPAAVTNGHFLMAALLPLNVTKAARKKFTKPTEGCDAPTDARDRPTEG